MKMTEPALLWLAGIYLFLAVVGLLLARSGNELKEKPGVKPQRYLREDQKSGLQGVVLQKKMGPPNQVGPIVSGQDNKDRFGVVRTFRVSFYCACERCCGDYARIPYSTGKRRTASGYRLKPDGSDAFTICAADRSIPFGTRIRIPDYGVVTVQDRGGAITGNRLDIYCGGDRQAHQIALNHGVKYLECEILTGKE